MSSISPRNILRHELIGLKTRVIYSKNPSHRVLEGYVVDESMKMLVIKRDGKTKKIPKRDAIFLFDLPKGPVEVEGMAVYGRPEDRVKKKIKRRW